MAHLPGLCESVQRSLCRAHHVMVDAAKHWRCRVPTHCPLCAGAAQGGALCAMCLDLVTQGIRDSRQRCARCCLVLDDEGQCPDCVAHRPAFDRIIAAFDYCAPADVLVNRLKVSRRFTDAPMLGRVLTEQVLRAWPDLPADLILVPVPSSAQALRRRGFNPAAEVARVLARRLNRPYRPKLLRRVQEGHKQATLNREERMISTSRLFQVAGDVQGACVAVVDDVLTTGSTMHSIARMLKHSGAASVHGLVLARTPHFLS